MSFDMTTLGEYIKVQGGYAYKSKDFIESSENKVLKIKNVRFRTIDYSAPAYVSNKIAETTTNWKVKEGDVLISMTGSGPNAPQSLVGRVARIWKNEPDAWINQRVGRICLLDKDTVHLDFIFYWLSLPQSQDYLVSNSSGSANQANISGKIIESLPCPKVDYQTSEQIADLARKFDEKIILNTQTNQTLEQMAQAIFKSWFVDFDPVKAKMNGEQPEGMDEATASLFPEKLVESELGLIPEGWEVKPFKKIIDKYVDNRGKTPPIVDNGIPLVEVKHLPERSAFPNLNTDKRVTEDTFNTWFRVHVEPKDVLISTVGTIGRTSFVKNTNFGIAQNVLGLRFGKVVEPEYMFYTIKAHRFQHDMDARLVTTVQSSIKRKDLDTIGILVPSSNVQKEFCKLVGSLLDGQYRKNAENIELTKLRDTLLPKLLSGEIDLGSEIN